MPAPNARAGPKQEGGGPAADMPTAPSLPQLNTTWLSDQALGDALASLSMSPMPQRQLSNEGAGPWAAALHPSPVFAPALPAARDAFPLARSNSAPASVPGNWQPEGGHWPSGPPALSLQAVDAAPPWAQGLGTWPAAAAAAPPGTQPRRLSAAAAALPAFSPVPRSAAAPHAASAAAPPPAPLPAPAAAGRHVSAAREEAEARSGGQEADQDGDDEEEAAEEEEEEDEEEEEGSEYGAEGASPEHAYLASINMMGMPRHQAAAVAALVAAAARFQPPQAPYAPRGAPSPRADGMLPPPLPPGSHPPPLPPSHGYMRYPPAMHAMGHAPPLPPPPPPSGYGAVPPLHLAYSPYVQHMAYPPRHAGIRPPYPLPVPPGPMSPVVARGPEGHRGYPPASSPRQAPSDDSPPSGDGRHVAAEATAARGAAGVQRGVGKLTPSRSRRTPAAATGAASRSPLAGPRSHAASMDTASQEDGQSDAEEGVRCAPPLLLLLSPSLLPAPAGSHPHAVRRSRVDRTRTRTRTRSSASTSSAHAAGPQTYFEVEFKRGRRHWFAWEGDNNGPDEMSVGDMVKVDADRGSDVGRVTRVAAELPPARGDNVAQRVKRLLRKARSDEVAHMPHKVPPPLVALRVRLCPPPLTMLPLPPRRRA